MALMNTSSGLMLLELVMSPTTAAANCQAVPFSHAEVVALTARLREAKTVSYRTDELTGSNITAVSPKP